MLDRKKIGKWGISTFYMCTILLIVFALIDFDVAMFWLFHFLDFIGVTVLLGWFDSNLLIGLCFLLILLSPFVLFLFQQKLHTTKYQKCLTSRTGNDIFVRLRSFTDLTTFLVLVGLPILIISFIIVSSLPERQPLPKEHSTYTQE